MKFRPGCVCRHMCVYIYVCMYIACIYIMYVCILYCVGGGMVKSLQSVSFLLQIHWAFGCWAMGLPEQLPSPASALLPGWVMKLSPAPRGTWLPAARSRGTSHYLGGCYLGSVAILCPLNTAGSSRHAAVGGALLGTVGLSSHRTGLCPGFVHSPLTV